jgi:hypothetical protein
MSTPDPQALADEIEQCWGYSIKIPTRIPKETVPTIIAALRHECPKPDPRAEVALRLLEICEDVTGQNRAYVAGLLREAQKADDNVR